MSIGVERILSFLADFFNEEFALWSNVSMNSLKVSLRHDGRLLAIFPSGIGSSSDIIGGVTSIHNEASESVTKRERRSHSCIKMMHTIIKHTQCMCL